MASLCTTLNFFSLYSSMKRRKGPAADLDAERPSVDIELRRYLAQDIEPDEICPVAFWASRRAGFPHLAVCVRNLQSITASSAPPANAFLASPGACSLP